MQFKRAWQLAFHEAEGNFISTRTIDAELHRHRRGRGARYEDASLLPSGTFVEAPTGVASLVYDGKLHPWCWNGYGPPNSPPSAERLRVITPEPTVHVLASGYVPVRHPSLSA